MTTFTGEKEVNTFVLVVIKNAIKLYANTGMKANRDYTPKNMLKKAGEFTGKVYRRGQLQLALDDLIKMYDDILKERQKAIDHEVDFQYHRIGHD